MMKHYLEKLIYFQNCIFDLICKSKICIQNSFTLNSKAAEKNVIISLPLLRYITYSGSCHTLHTHTNMKPPVLLMYKHILKTEKSKKKKIRIVHCSINLTYVFSEASVKNKIKKSVKDNLGLSLCVCKECIFMLTLTQNGLFVIVGDVDRLTNSNHIKINIVFSYIK